MQTSAIQSTEINLIIKIKRIIVQTMSEEINIPKHWQIKKLGEVCFTTSGGTPNRGNKSFYEGNIPWVKSGELNQGLITNTEENISEEAIKKSSAKVFPKGTLLIALYGATIGKLAFLGVDAATNQAICGIYKNENIDSYFLYYYLFSKKPSLVKQGIGGAQPNISQGILKNLELPLPPLSEQQAIVFKIEELLSDLENGKQQLQIAQQQLKIYRQSLLKWAFEGKLCLNYDSCEKSLNFDSCEKSLNHDSCEKSLNYDSCDLGDEQDLKNEFGKNQGNHINHQNHSSDNLPKGWKVMELGDVIIKIEAGKSFRCNERTPEISEVGVLKVSAVTWQVFNEIESKTVIDIERVNKDYFVKKDDFLFSRANTLELIGAVVLVNSIERTLMLSDKTLRFIFKSNVSKKYILYYLRSRKGRSEIQRLSTGNQESMRNIGQQRIRQIAIPIPPLKEQQLIVDELESKLTVCDKIEETIKDALLKSESLRQSILKKAFEGKLCLNNDSDDFSEKHELNIITESSTLVKK